MIKIFEKYTTIRGLYEDKDSNKVKISFDEKAKIAIKEYFGSIYTKEKSVFYPAKQKVKGLLEMPAGLNIETGKVHYWFYDWKNSFVVIDCFEKLLNEYPGKEIYVILDNWIFLNKIERVFAFLSRDILQNSNFQTAREAMENISAYFDKEGSIMV
jgi:hypothetical protein